MFVQLYTDRVPNEFYAPAVRAKFGNSLSRQMDDAEIGNQGFLNKVFGTIELPFYIVLEPRLEDDRVDVVGTYQGLIGDPMAFADFLRHSAEEPAVATTTVEPKSAANVVIKPIKLGDFDALLQKHKGSILLVDFWFRYCVPCELALPHLVRMQTENAAKGLVVLTVDAEDPKEPNAAEAVKFLKKNNITLTNLILDENDDVDDWRRKLDLSVFPTTFLYDRQGKLVRRFEGERPEVIEKAVIELLKK
jgi:thiol-disulfide isomerase/thioredoxin